MTSPPDINKVLIVGNNPNVQLYTSRFQENKDIELYHVSNLKSNVFKMDTFAYGTAQYEIDNHFTSISNLVEALQELTGSPHALQLDLIILSASSLRELSTLPTELGQLIGSNTNILIESTGFLSLEQFIESDKVFASETFNGNVFSILTTYDVRELGPNNYQQYGNSSESQTIFIGQNSKTTNYPDDIASSMNVLETIFRSVFVNDKVSSCNHSPVAFLSEQWSMAIPKMCLDPLLILFEEKEVSKFPQQVLAKPLLSGLITEVLTIAKTMNIRLKPKMENEDHILEAWKSNNSGNNIPGLLYHFIEEGPSLDLDLLLLQPILLADDCDIKTPYLEFLYTVMMQYDKINRRESDWFVRSEMYSALKEKHGLLKDEKDILERNYLSLQTQNEDLRQKLMSRITDLERENDQLRRSNFNNQQQDVIDDLMRQLRDAKLNQTQMRDNSRAEDTAPLNIGPTSSNEVFHDSTDADVSFEERERQIKKKEQELLERELEIKKATRQQQMPAYTQMPSRQQSQSVPYFPNSNPLTVSPPQNNASVFPPAVAAKQYVPPNAGYQNKSNHSSPNLPVSSSNFVDPITAGLSPPLDSSEFGAASHKQSYASHHIKPTSRKNRQSHLPRIGHASSIAFNAMGNQNGNMGAGKRVSSLPTAYESNRQQRQTTMMDFPQPTTFANPDAGVGFQATSPDSSRNNSGTPNPPIQFGHAPAPAGDNGPVTNTPQQQSGSATPIAISHEFGSAPPAPSEPAAPISTDIEAPEPTEKPKKKKFSLFGKKDKKK
ncbi:Pam1p KNAG_0A04050 [Huiozyma naganishii CBS 8797]|uniref:Ketopantoate reductase C-terminal domain-containing protein n=1 Tax=Huiozyma naganishii (strain ATCC MYA-139 / BCRC 22969 / CBS 8797 / KCTC 17520 / NBRC 10181 / NCYC 3082 / Yp74L-3) TaxID=1071383 RepID=J7S2C3_HUIN7|nr:hypothetical protein KNAG_0A04050 [Kazachstania naganishii CBS 8797]CCK68084.1 hypothetical protein KNAG_0A04050 [Kazachstania naganishii CBS 8797]